jgi:hypothetical protein
MTDQLQRLMINDRSIAAINGGLIAVSNDQSIAAGND